MRPIDFCTPKPFQLEHSRSAVSQRSDFPCDALLSLHAAWGPLSSRSLATPCSFTRPSLVALHLTHPKACEAGIGQLGAFRCETRPGRISLHGAIPTSATGRCSRGGVFFRRVKSNPDRLWHPCRLLRAVHPGSLFFESQMLARRPPRSVPRGPRERRALCRPRVPSTDRRDAHLARAEARTKPRSLQRRRGAHVMRIAELR